MSLCALLNVALFLCVVFFVVGFVFIFALMCLFFSSALFLVLQFLVSRLACVLHEFNT